MYRLDVGYIKFKSFIVQIAHWHKQYIFHVNNHPFQILCDISKHFLNWIPSRFGLARAL